jgi:hypothetical protein
MSARTTPSSKTPSRFQSTFVASPSAASLNRQPLDESGLVQRQVRELAAAVVDLVAVVVEAVAVGVAHERRVGRAHAPQRTARVRQPDLMSELVEEAGPERPLPAAAHVAELGRLPAAADVDLHVVGEAARALGEVLVAEVPPRATRRAGRERRQPDRMEPDAGRAVGIGVGQ